MNPKDKHELDALVDDVKQHWAEICKLWTTPAPHDPNTTMISVLGQILVVIGACGFAGLACVILVVCLAALL